MCYLLQHKFSWNMVTRAMCPQADIVQLYDSFSGLCNMARCLLFEEAACKDFAV
jgi:hypothetical protein